MHLSCSINIIITKNEDNNYSYSVIDVLINFTFYYDRQCQVLLNLHPSFNIHLLGLLRLKYNLYDYILL